MMSKAMNRLFQAQSSFFYISSLAFRDISFLFRYAPSRDARIALIQYSAPEGNDVDVTVPVQHRRC